MSVPTKAWKLIKMISLLEGKYAKYDRQRLMEILDISKSTFYRYKDTLEEAEVPIIYDKRANGYKIREDYYMRPPELSISEALALVVSGNSILNNSELPYSKEINMAIAKVMAVLPNRTKNFLASLGERIHFSLDSLVDYSQYGEVFNTLSDAIKEEVNVWIKYDPASREGISKREVSPYILDFKNGALYLYAHCHLRNQIRMFRVDRILEIKLTNKNFIYPDDFSIEDYLGNAWGVERGKEEIEIKIKFSGQAVRNVREHTYHPTQELEELDDGSILMSVVTCSINEVKQWVLGFGAEAEVIAPKSLREEIAGEVQEMWGRYN
ncbi:helix-turn-helix transcriptional regulator [Selenihalanaerobacter shriftii]|uniref:Predicted DNA-binding transcriptional regulator YafY, contains an HTH and WYL domains n=1 Tax=Selenihalanaerobacter shriftii TaxID=142842 RepID=A0A1T4PID7_9FIRM|nr:WYL domain-containing protein [Selenihalanaerobacter shriftii]SJZ90966.1 Predicted DNA-binding transcriptional regulator YafY, contains an HTH and WYL domains [Selenihalanaerobacter shriftii]